jgi:hypothetical protein
MDATSQADLVRSFQAAVESVQSIIQDNNGLDAIAGTLRQHIRYSHTTIEGLKEELNGSVAANHQKDKDLKAMGVELKLVQMLYFDAMRERNEEEQRSRLKDAKEVALRKRKLEVFEEAMKQARTSGP